MPNPLDAVWRALADPTRRALLELLRAGPRTTGQLVESVPTLTRFGVMKHLTVLESAGLVIVERRGRERWNHLNAVPLKRIYERWVSRYEDRWAGSLLRLKHAMETPPEGARKGESTMNVKLLEHPARIAQVVCEIVIDAPKAKVYRAWFDDTRNWFFDNPEDIAAKPFLCEEKLGGRFYHQLPGGGFNVLGEITMIKPEHKIRMRGDCTMPEAVLMNMTISFTEEGKGTRVRIDHHMMGEFADETPKGFEEGWMSGLRALKTLLESSKG